MIVRHFLQWVRTAEVCERAAGQLSPINGVLAWPAMLRLLDEKDPSYKE